MTVIYVRRIRGERGYGKVCDGMSRGRRSVKSRGPLLDPSGLQSMVATKTNPLLLSAKSNQQYSASKSEHGQEQS